jgi:hypothetical protein
MSKSPFQIFREWVHTPKPPLKTYKHDPDHKVFRYTKTTQNSRIVEDRYGRKVQCKLNGVTPLIQAILGFLCQHILDIQEDVDDTIQQSQLIDFLQLVHEHCQFGMLFISKKNSKYAQLVNMPHEFNSAWFNRYHSDYILTIKDAAEYTSFQALLALLQNPGNMDVDVATLEQIVKGFIYVCALPDSLFERCFDEYKHDIPDAKNIFFKTMVEKLKSAVDSLWKDKHLDTPIYTYNSGEYGMGREIYFNIRDRYF